MNINMLYKSQSDQNEAHHANADCLADLGIMPIIDTVCSGRAHGEFIRNLFCTPLHDISVIQYRQEVWADISNPAIEQAIRQYVKMLGEVRASSFNGTSGATLPIQYETHIIESILRFHDGACQFVNTVKTAQPQSHALRTYRDALSTFLETEEFQKIESDARRIHEDLNALRFMVRLEPNALHVWKMSEDKDMGNMGNGTHPQSIESIARRIAGPFVDTNALSAKHPEEHFEHHIGDEIDTAILNRLQACYPELFDEIREFASLHVNFLPDSLDAFDSQISFYLSWLDFIEPLIKHGYTFDLPKISNADNGEEVHDCFEPRLAISLLQENKRAVVNSYHLEDNERIIVVTGANQGGKTTFSRTFGQLHYFASLGLPIPASSARIFIPDVIMTHYSKSEDPDHSRGRLKDDIVRFKAILNNATADSLIIANEAFSSTTALDALEISRIILSTIRKLGCLCVWVTFLDELAREGTTTVSLVATVSDDADHQRTYRLERKTADGHAFAIRLAHAHHVTREEIIERIKDENSTAVPRSDA